ncbi:hypothetical protein [Phenylobacterium sp.]|jgi:hypothetical protein|uniref:hypothetical protein n=1 Tax=Phenylobacterium sp. TaxID=1871053 RepID=UPI0025F46A9D|nr:hypothetical protein [Phenylobacterium sp.]|tara:strand:+ start:3633 stop:4133 length:501 start_codon:yes stop_codon:yes gene_type:complete
MTPYARMKPLSLRSLTEGEAALGREMFGQGLEPRRIRILSQPLWPRAFAAGSRLMVFPHRAAAADFSQASLGLQGLFVHELTHVWQAQRGIGLLGAKLRCGDGPEAYAYDLMSGHSFHDLNIEQQAMVVQHAFLASRRAPTPYSPLAYGAFLAGFCAFGPDKPRKV